jgi:1,2-diacylglycerol 3-alpha-glucosyltransferase
MITMKILVCASEYFPYGSGIANVIYNVVEQLKKQGVDCTVCSPTGPDIALGSKKLIKKFGYLGLLYYWYQVSHFFEHTDYDAVWLQNPNFFGRNPFPHCLITMHSTYYGKTYHHVANKFFLGMYYKVISLFERYCLRKISKTIVFTGVGLSVCDELEKMGIDKMRIMYIPNGANVQNFKQILDKKSIRQNFGIPYDNIILLSVGRLNPAKQPETLIKVFSLLEKRMSKITLCIAGTGELLGTIKNLVNDEGLQKVIFLGQVDHKTRLPDLYAASDYFIMTSIYEGGMPPLTLSEAMASGLPCIVSDIPSLGIVREADCGIIVNFNDKENAIQRIMDYLSVEHPEHVENAREYALKNLDWEKITEQYLKIFLNIQKNKEKI